MNRRVTLASRPTGFPQESDFTLDEAEVPSPGPGEVLVRERTGSPSTRTSEAVCRRRGRTRKGLELGDVVTAQAVGEVVESENDSRYEPGDFVLGQLGWQDYAVARGGTLRKLPPGLEPQLALHVLGATGPDGVLRAAGRGEACSRRHGRRLRRGEAPSARSSDRSRASWAAAR